MIIQGDTFDLIKELEDNSVDLVITSPPYSDIVNYGKLEKEIEWTINKYDLNNNFIKAYPNALQAFKDNPTCYSFHNIIRCYDRKQTDQTCGGFIWKKEKLK